MGRYAAKEAAVVGDIVRHGLAHWPHVVVVDDGSDDEAAAYREGATIIRHPVNIGQGAVLSTEIEYTLQHGAH